MRPRHLPDEEGTERGVKSFAGHLEDLRRALAVSLGALCAGFLIVLPLAPSILDWLKAPVRDAGYDPDTFLQVLRVAGPVSITLRIMLWGGILLALPVIVGAVIWFVFPGLKQTERSAVRWGLGVSGGLFALGVTSAYMLVARPVFAMMMRIGEWLNIRVEFIELADYVAFMLKLLLAFGLAYELPAVIVLLGFMGIVTSADLRRYRRHVIIGLLALAMVLTPPDPLSQVMMAVPLMVLFEAALWIVWLRERQAVRRRNRG